MMRTATKTWQTLEIHYADGSTSRYPRNYAEAVEKLKEEYGPEIVFCESWDADGPDAERQLVWECEEDAENDSGSKAIAQIVRRGTA